MIFTLQAGDGGLASDLDGMDAADKLWSDGRNVRFENGYLKPFDGHTAIYDPPSAVPYGIFPLRIATANIWVYTGLASAWAVSNSGVHTDITRAAGSYTATADTKWTGGALTSYLVFNNVNDAPQSWSGDTSADAILLANWTSTHRCAAMRPLRNYLVAVNITKVGTNYPVLVKWSHAADPGALPSSWDHTDPTKDAGEQDIADTNGTLVDLVQLGDLGIIYASDSYHSMQYIGGTYVWRFGKIFGGAGALSQNCAIEYPGGHCVLTSGDIITHSGGAPTSVINARMRSNLFNAIDTTNYGRSFLVHNEQRSEIWACVPESGQTAATKAYVWNYAQNSWGIRDLPNASAGNIGPVVSEVANTWATSEGTWASDTGNWSNPSLAAIKRRTVLTAIGTKLYVMDDGTTYGGSSPEMYVERTGLDMGDPARIKFAKSVRPYIDAPQGTVVNVRLGGQMFADGQITWSSATPYTVGSSRAVYLRTAGRFIGVRLESTAGATWRCRKLDIEYVDEGQR